MTVRRLYDAACSKSAVCRSARQPASLRLLRFPKDRRGVADLQHVDLEPREDLALDRLRKPELREPRAVRAVRVVGHGRDLCLLAVRALLGPGCGEDARGRGEVEPEVGGDAGIVVDRRPRPPKITGGAVGLIHDREVEAVHLLPVQPLPARQSSLQRPANLPLAHGSVDVLTVHQRGVRGEHDDWSVPGP